MTPGLAIFRPGQRPGAYNVYCNNDCVFILRKGWCGVWETVDISEEQSYEDVKYNV